MSRWPKMHMLHRSTVHKMCCGEYGTNSNANYIQCQYGANSNTSLTSYLEIFSYHIKQQV